MIEINCEICLAVEDALTDIKFLWNKPLYETKNFLVLPSIGPLEDGHCLIVSKSHHLNLLTMDAASIQDFQDIVNYSTKKFGENLLFTEHGSFNQQAGGACIEHTHVHIIPNLASFYNILDDVLPINDSFTNLLKFDVIDFPYIFTLNPKKEFRLYNAYNAHSQMMRKAICLKQNRFNWDWKKNEDLDRIKKNN